MVAFDLLRVGFVDGMGSRRQVPPINSCGIGIKVRQAKRLERLL
jgi:hypothetical protein